MNSIVISFNLKLPAHVGYSSKEYGIEAQLDTETYKEGFDKLRKIILEQDEISLEEFKK